jgi:DNA polymerase (family 10)
MGVNQELAQRFSEIAAMLELLGEDSFRASAHARAARNIADLPFDLEPIAGDAKKLLEIEGIGKGIAAKITEYCSTGQMKEHAELAAKVPATLLELLKIGGIGPKTVRAIWVKTGITDTAGLNRIIEDGSILEVPRLGSKAVEKIKTAMELAVQGDERLWLGRAMPVAETIIEQLSTLPGIEKIAYAGSLRRGRDTVGDLDILVASREPKPISEAFRALPQVTNILAAGDTRSSVRIGVGAAAIRRRDGGPNIASIQCDLRILPPESWGAALMYFTGSKDHNVRLRERALKKGLTLNEYGLFPEDPAERHIKTPPQQRGIKPVASATEEEIYAKLGLPYIPPEIREDRGELELKEPPRLIELGDIKSELHAHTTASDGSMPIEELAEFFKSRGFHTVAVTDHSQSQAIAGGLKPDRLLEHIDAVRSAGAKVKGIRILAGAEVDILADGRLDYDEATLAKLDIVVASPHAALTQRSEDATARLLRAIQNPHVDIIGHPTGRLVNRRAGVSPDVARLAAAAKEHDVALEINAHWHRLDLRDVHARVAVQAGCLIAINCDTHSRADADNLRYGVLTARRGWVTPEQCLNAWDQKRLLAWLKRRRG